MGREKKGLATGPDNPLRRSARWTAARREEYLAVLRETGNGRAAAEAVGMDRSTLRGRRRQDPAFDRACRDAVAAADARLAALRGRGQSPEGQSPSGAGGEAEGLSAGPDGFEAIRRGPDGRLRIVAVGTGRWNAAIEARFLALLRENGNISSSARAVGFTADAVWARRRKWPAFAEALEAVLDEAEVTLEFRLVAMRNDVVGMGTVARDCPHDALPLDPEFALRFLKWREDKRAGRARRGRHYGPREPTIEEVRDSVLGKLAAIRRHREAGKGDGD